MKKILSALAIVFLLNNNSFGQQRKPVNNIAVPATVKAAFIEKYPGASNVIWKRRVDNYEARWGKEHSVVFTPLGKFIEETVPIQVNQLPEEALKYIKMTYKTPVTAAGKVTDLQGKTSYVAQVKGRDLLFDRNGRFMKSAKK